MNEIVPYRSELPSFQQQNVPQYAPASTVLRSFVGIVMSRASFAIAVSLVVFVLALCVAAALPRTYYAEGSLIIQPRRSNPAEVNQTPSALPPDTSAVDTEVEVLRSRALAEAVVRKLKLYND